MAVTQAQFERELTERLVGVGFELTKKDVQEILDITGQTVQDLLKNELTAYGKAARAAKKDGGKVANPVVVARSLGRFTIRHYPARMGRNPQTGEKMKIKASKKMQVKAPKHLRDALGVK